MKKTLLVGLVFGFILTSCEEDISDYNCNCTYTLGVTQGNDDYEILGATQTEAEQECSDYETDLGGNTKCELE